MVRLNLIFYGKHSPEDDESIIKVRPEYAIVNTPHGLWGEVNGHGTPWLLQNGERYREAGIKVIGYITSGYEGTGSGGMLGNYWYTLEMNRKLVKGMAELDHVDGVFIDECSAYPNAESKKYLKELTDLIHSYGLIAWGNVGENDFDSWYFNGGGFRLMHSTEQWHGQKLTRVQKKWGSHISVTGFNPEYTSKEALRLTRDAWDKGIAYCYISDNGYGNLPSWLEEYASLLRG